MIDCQRQKIVLWGDFEHVPRHGSQSKGIPRSIPLSISVCSVSCGWQHVLLRTASHQLYGLGSNRVGQLGLGPEVSTVMDIPQLIPLQNSQPLKMEQCGPYHSMVLDTGGNLYGCGQNTYGAVGSNTQHNIYSMLRIAIGILSVSCGGRHTLAINNHRRVFGWGDNEQGQLALTNGGPTVYWQPTSLDIYDVDKVAAGSNVSLFLKKGKVYGCGGNNLGQLGLGHKEPVFNLTEIEIGKPVVQIHSGNYTQFVTNDKQCYFSGTGIFGELLLPVLLQTCPDLESVSSGRTFGFFRSSANNYYGWGSNLQQQLTCHSTKGYRRPVELKQLNGVELLACGNNFVVAVRYKTKEFLDLTGKSFFSSESDDQLEKLRKENDFLRRKLQQITYQQRFQMRPQANDNQRMQELQKQIGLLRQSIHKMQKDLQQTTEKSLKLQKQNELLCRAMTELRNKDHGEFGHFNSLLTVYDDRLKFQKLQSEKLKDRLFKASQTYQQLLDSVHSDSFLRVFFGFQKRSQRKDTELDRMLEAVGKHSQKLRQILLRMQIQLQ